jgi:NTE family protein
MRSEIFNFLSSVSLFKGLSKSVIQKIYANVEEISVPSFKYIYQPGHPSNYIYIVRYGEVVVRIGENGDKFRYIGQGEVFSEHSIVTQSSHYGSAQAILDTLLYAIDGNAFIALTEKNKILSRNLIRLVAGRMKDVLFSQENITESRRLICHIPLEKIENFKESLEEVLETGRLAQLGEMNILDINYFLDMSPQQTISELSSLRKTYPVLHVYIENPASACDLSSVVMQADQLVIWENNPFVQPGEKKQVIKFWKSCIRNFEERSIRMIQHGVALHRQSYIGKNKVFIRKETLSRFLISKTRGLALGGGGARSLAHIGMIKVLEEENIKIDFITGCSFGAIIGALYARGENYLSIMKIMEKYFSGLRPPIFDARLPVISFYKGQNMVKMVREEFADLEFEDLRIPFVTVAVDLLTGKEVVFNKGPLWEALAATMSLPGIFPPRVYGKALLADGGILNNIPDNLIRDMGANIIISANVAPLEDSGIVKMFQTKSFKSKLSIRQWWENLTHPPILKIINRAINLEGREIIKLRRKNMDFFVNFKLDQYTIFDFRKYKNIVAEGERQFRQYLPEVKNLLLPRKQRKPRKKKVE